MEFLDDPNTEHYASPIITYLPTFAALQILSPDDMWVKYMHGMVDGFAALVVDKGDWAYIPFRFYSYGGDRTEKGPPVSVTRKRVPTARGGLTNRYHSEST